MVAAPFCGKLLAGYGAEVIKVERPRVGDPLRAMGVFKDDIPHPETGAVHLFLDSAKRSITLDVATATGRAVLVDLLQRVDVVLTDYTPAQLSELRLDYASLEAIDAKLILTAISFFGQTGPYRNLPANELTGFAMSGYLYTTGYPEREPVKGAGSIGQYQGGLQASAGTMGAVLYRNLCGRGQLVDVSIAEALCMEAGIVPAWINSGEFGRRVGNRTTGTNPKMHYPSQYLPCKDGWVFVRCTEDLTEMAAFMEEPRLADPEILAEPKGHADLIDQLCLPWLSRYDKYEVVQRAQAAKHAFSEILELSEVLEDPQHAARNFFVEVDHPVAGRFKMPGSPIQDTESGWRMSPAPQLGEANEAIYVDELGYGREDLRLLRERGII